MTGKVAHRTLTLSGSVQTLLAAFSDTTVGGVDDPACQAIILQPDGANAGVVYVGGEGATITSSEHGFSLPAGVAGVPPAPFELPFSTVVRPSQVKVLGTNTQKLHILFIVL